MKTPFAGRGRRFSIMLAAGIAVSVAGIGTLLASDHQDTPEAELNPRMDANDGIRSRQRVRPARRE